MIINSINAQFKCRFGLIEGAKEKTSALYTLANPTGVAKKQKSFLQKWSTKGELANCVALDESLSALAVRDDGRFVALGTMFSGSVEIYTAFNLNVGFLKRSDSKLYFVRMVNTKRLICREFWLYLERTLCL